MSKEYPLDAIRKGLSETLNAETSKTGARSSSAPSSPRGNSSSQSALSPESLPPISFEAEKSQNQKECLSKSKGKDSGSNLSKQILDPKETTAKIEKTASAISGVDTDCQISIAESTSVSVVNTLSTDSTIDQSSTESHSMEIGKPPIKSTESALARKDSASKVAEDILNGNASDPESIKGLSTSDKKQTSDRNGSETTVLDKKHGAFKTSDLKLAENSVENHKEDEKVVPEEKLKENIEGNAVSNNLERSATRERSISEQTSDSKPMINKKLSKSDEPEPSGTETSCEQSLEIKPSEVPASQTGDTSGAANIEPGNAKSSNTTPDSTDITSTGANTESSENGRLTSRKIEPGTPTSRKANEPDAIVEIENRDLENCSHRIDLNLSLILGNSFYVISIWSFFMIGFMLIQISICEYSLEKFILACELAL